MATLRVDAARSERGLVMVIPTYNEALNVDRLIDGLGLARERVPFDVLVVDDNSPDGTGRAVRRLVQRHRWLHLLERVRPMGLGSAYRDGFAWALDRGFRYIGEMDADLSHDPTVVPDLYAVAEGGAALVLGSRYVAGGRCEGWPRRRRLLSRAANVYARTLLRLPIRDVTGGFRVYRRSAVELLVAHSTECAGYGFQIEAVVALTRAGLVTTEIPITFRDRKFGSSKMSARTALEAARRCVAMALHRPARVRTPDPQVLLQRAAD